MRVLDAPASQVLWCCAVLCGSLEGSITFLKRVIKVQLNTVMIYLVLLYRVDLWCIVYRRSTLPLCGLINIFQMNKHLSWLKLRFKCTTNNVAVAVIVAKLIWQAWSIGYRRVEMTDRASLQHWIPSCGDVCKRGVGNRYPLIRPYKKKRKKNLWSRDQVTS